MKQHRRRRSVRTLGPAEIVETRSLLSSVSVTPASVDGTGNNVENPDYGSVDTELLRLTTVEYEDGISTPAGEDRVSAREVSNAIAAQDESTLNDRNLTDFTWIWGQFLDHDITLSEGAEPTEEFNIEVPEGDAWFDPFGTGEVELGFSRTVYSDDSSGEEVREQINQITAFIDGSVVYGSDQERADALRTFEGGLLNTSEGDLLPFNTEGLHNAGGDSESLFLAGDIRANENVALASMHTIFVREHNRIAAELAEADPSLTDEELYQQARSIVTAQIQVITYNEFLPALLGTDALSEYTGYDSSVNPGISNEFSTAAYRFGHTLLSPELQRLDENGEVLESGNLSLQNAFFDMSSILDEGIDPLLRGAASQLAQELDTQVIDDVRNFLFGAPGSGGLDLASLNIQRGRDHGLADYNQAREDLGLGRVSSFDEITSDPELAAALEATYGTVDEIDLWVGGLAEDHLDGTSMGETFTAIIVDQFERLRDGDRYWYENVFSGDLLAEIESTSLSDIIERNTTIEGLQENVFFAAGTEILDVNLETVGTDRVSVSVDNGTLEIHDLRNDSLIVSRPVDEVSEVVLRGADGVREQFVVSGDQFSEPMTIVVDGGSSVGDTLIFQGTDLDDEIDVVGQNISLDNLDLVFSDIDRLMIDGEAGDDLIDVSEADLSRIVVQGGTGDDTVLGAHDSDAGRTRKQKRNLFNRRDDSGRNQHQQQQRGHDADQSDRNLHKKANNDTLRRSKLTGRRR